MSAVFSYLIVCAVLATLLTLIQKLEHGKLSRIRRPFAWLARLPAWLSTWMFLMVFAMAFMVVQVILSSGLPYAARFIGHAMQLMGVRWFQLVTAVAVITLGFFAHWFKGKNQVAYGAVEVVIAGLAAVVAAKQIRFGVSVAPIVATLIASVYVVSRGLGNYAEGRAKRMKAAIS